MFQNNNFKLINMTKEQVIIQTKATALNKIRNIYNHGYGLTSNPWDDSYAEQRDYMVSNIIAQLEKDLLKLKNK